MALGAGEYLVIVAGELRQFGHVDEIPDEFEHIIKFSPEIPPGPHTPEQHEEIEQLPALFQSFMEKERARSNKGR